MVIEGTVTRAAAQTIQEHFKFATVHVGRIEHTAAPGAPRRLLNGIQAGWGDDHLVQYFIWNNTWWFRDQEYDWLEQQDRKITPFLPASASAQRVAAFFASQVAMDSNVAYQLDIDYTAARREHWHAALKFLRHFADYGDAELRAGAKTYLEAVTPPPRA